MKNRSTLPPPECWWVSHVELLILHEVWARERLVLEKAVPRCRWHGRPISVSAALIFGAPAVLLEVS